MRPQMDTDAGRQKCREKTARGNVFHSKAAAKRAASRQARHVGKAMNWFRCCCCGGYHIGSWRSQEEQLRRAKEAHARGGSP